MYFSSRIAALGIAASCRIEKSKVKQASPAFSLIRMARHARKQQVRKHTRNKGDNSGTVPLLAAFLGTEKGQLCRYHDHLVRTGPILMVMGLVCLDRSACIAAIQYESLVDRC